MTRGSENSAMTGFDNKEGYVRKDASPVKEISCDLSDAKTISISNRSIIMAIAIILILVIGAVVLTQVLPRGSYERSYDPVTETDYIVQGSYHEDDSLPKIKWWQVILAPFMILDPNDEGALMVWAILALLLVIGAVFTALNHTGIMVYMVESMRNRFSNKKYALLFVLPFAFMFLGSTAGMFEELIPLTPVVILLSTCSAGTRSSAWAFPYLRRASALRLE